MVETSDSLVFSGQEEDLSILLIKRGKDPYKDYWALPGGFSEKGEDSFAAALRELKEETGLDLDGHKRVPLSLYQKEARDPRGPTRTSPFFFYREERPTARAADDAKECRWFTLEEISELAFDHGQMILEALGKSFFYMPQYDAAFDCLKLPPPFKKFDFKFDEATFFLGSFNPWHEGHSECLKQALEVEEKRNIIVLPDKNPWKKNLYEKEYVKSFSFYRDLCFSLSKLDVECCPTLLGGEKENYTSDWLLNTKVKRKSLLLGDDNFFDLKRWKNHEGLLHSLCEILVVPRLYQVEKIESVREELLSKYEHLNIRILKTHSFQGLSSSALRNGRI